MKNVRLAFFYFFAYISLGCVLSQLMVLLNEDFSIAWKSSILGFSALLSFVLSLFLGKMSDRLQQLKPSFYISLALYLLCITGITFLNETWIKGFFYIGMIASSRTLMSSSETIVFIEKKDDFAKYHCLGALGLIVGSFSSNLFVGVSRWIFCLLCSLCSFLLIRKYQESLREQKPIQMKDILSLLKKADYMRIVFIFFFLMLMGFADQYIVVDKMLALGATKSLISLKYALQAFMEIPVYLCVQKVFEKIDMYIILLFCICMSALKFFLYGVASSSIWILLVASLQVFTHPLIILLSKKMIASCTSNDLIASSQIVGFAIYFGLSGFVSAFLGALLSRYFSFDVALYVFASFAIFPLILWYYSKKYDKV